MGHRARELGRQRTGFDRLLIFLTIFTSVLGVVAVYSATYSFGSISQVLTQLGALVIGAAVMFIAGGLDFEGYKFLSIPAFIVSMVLLVAVLAVGQSGDWGAQSWIRFGPVGIQPGEICKIGFILSFAHHLSAVAPKINKPSTLFLLALHLLAYIGLILLQPDMGSAMVFIFMFILMLFTAGLSLKLLSIAGVIGVASLPLIYHFVLSEYQQHRIQVFFNPELDKLGSGYNVIQSKIAVGSGQLFGKGYLKGTQNQLGFLPTKHTDFIFSTIAEEFGFIGAVVILVLLFMIIFRCVKIAHQSNNRFGRFVATGVSSMLIFHTFENIGMCIGLMPVTGIPLPFISYGGTSLVTNMFAIGLVLSVSRKNKSRYFN